MLATPDSSSVITTVGITMELAEPALPTNVSYCALLTTSVVMKVSTPMPRNVARAVPLAIKSAADAWTVMVSAP